MRVLAITLCATALVFAQQLTTETIVSPDVHTDGRVTFRLHAPKGTEVAFAGDWMPRGTSQPMVKGDDGTWTITVGPLRPSIYIYNFILDGLPIADPGNPRVKLRARTSASLVEVRSEKPDPWTPQDVPHGTVHINWQKSKVLGDDPRWIWIYTPPGYEKQQNRRYPVLYLFHEYRLRSARSSWGDVPLNVVRTDAVRAHAD